MTARVLVVDDELLVASNLRAFLEDEGMDVETVGSAEEALALVRVGRTFDVCIMDLRLPGMDGSTAMRELHELNPLLQFVIHTGSIHFSIPNDLEAIGIHDTALFKKPVPDMAILADAVRRLAAG